MSLQAVYFYVGVGGFALALAFAAAAAVYFVKADVRGKLAELSGKIAGETQTEKSSRKRRALRNAAQLNDVQFEGGIEYAEVRKATDGGKQSADSYKTRRNPKAALKEKQKKQKDACEAKKSQPRFRIVESEVSFGSAYFIDKSGSARSHGIANGKQVKR